MNNDLLTLAHAKLIALRNKKDDGNAYELERSINTLEYCKNQQDIDFAEGILKILLENK